MPIAPMLPGYNNYVLGENAIKITKAIIKATKNRATKVNKDFNDLVERIDEQNKGKIERPRNKADDLVDMYTKVDRSKKVPNILLNTGPRKIFNVIKKSKILANNVTPKIAKLLESGINLAGKIKGKDFSKSAEWARKALEMRHKKIAGVSIKSKTWKKFTKFNNRTDAGLAKWYKNLRKKIPSKWKNIKKAPKTLFGKVFKGNKFRRGFGKAKNFLGKFKKSNLIKKLPKKGMLSKLGKGFAKAFSPLGFAANAYTAVNDKSNFKRALAGLDIVGDLTAGVPVVGTAISGITSALNFGGALAYDLLGTTEFGKKINKVLDHGAGFVVKPVAKAFSWAGKGIKSMFKGANSIKNSLSKKFSSGVGKGIDYAKQKIGKVKGFFSGLFSRKKKLKPVKPSFINKIINMTKSPYNKNWILKNTAKGKKRIIPKISTENISDYISSMNVRVKSQAKTNNISNPSHSSSSNNNNFNVHISGNNLSVKEIANELVSEIKTSMANI
ncbi:hypothetical protein PV797_05335 [Clostridiaceae bacterium M8S5]|nr:hypothetical protein PV797_05335 [Clostridiaceae bacterium M8S5]